MAAISTPYNHARYLLATGALDLSTGNIVALLVQSGYTPDFDNHQFASSITNECTGNGYVRKTLTYAGVTRVAKGTNRTRFSSDVVSFSASGGSIVCRRMLVIKDTGTPSTSPLLWSTLLDSTPADVTILDGGRLDVTPHATDGWLYL